MVTHGLDDVGPKESVLATLVGLGEATPDPLGSL
jgi:hypothetical protein